MSEELTMWVVYDHPRDFPDWFVARKWSTATPTSEVLRSVSLRHLRAQIREREPHLVRFGRAENDDPKIVEVWL